MAGTSVSHGVTVGVRSSWPWDAWTCATPSAPTAPFPWGEKHFLLVYSPLLGLITLLVSPRGW